jgi:hypothetical protein
MLPSNLTLPLLLLTVACGGDVEEAVPDGEWNVQVTGVATDCTDSNQGFQKTYVYQLFFNGSAADVKIKGSEDEPVTFATGSRSGCQIAYESLTFLDERDGGEINWMITGESIYEASAGGCSLENGVDWLGTEVLEVTASTVESVPEGCTYTFETKGTYLGAGE